MAVIGVWDPILPEHLALFADLRRHAARHGLASLVLAFDPDPVRYLCGVAELPVYDDARVRTRRIRRCGVDAVLRVRFAKPDIDAGAADLFRLAEAHVPIAELWLGARQTLGRLEAGNFDTIQRLAAERGTLLHRLPDQRLQTRDVRLLLRSGHLSRAVEIVGRPPVWRRPRSGRLRLAWHPGGYRVIPLHRADAAVEGRALDVELVPDSAGLPTLAWPDRSAPYLAIVRGPNDSSERN